MKGKLKIDYVIIEKSQNFKKKNIEVNSSSSSPIDIFMSKEHSVYEAQYKHGIILSLFFPFLPAYNVTRLDF